MISNYLLPSDFIKSAYSVTNLSTTNSYLSQQNIEINVYDHLGQSAFSIAVSNRNVGFVKALLKSKKKINLNVQDTTVLHIALSNNYLIGGDDCKEILNLILHALMTSGDVKDIINKSDKSGDTPISLIVKYGYIDILREFFEYHPNLSIRDIHGNTPLNKALKTKQIKITLDILDYIFFNKAFDVLDITNDQNESPLLLATLLGNTKILIKILHGSSNILHCDKKKQNILHVCFSLSNEKISLILINYLLKRKKVLSDLLAMVDFNGNTPLMVAIIGHKFQIARSLLKYNPNFDLQNKDGNNILHLVALSRSEPLALIMCDYANQHTLNTENNNGQTPLNLLAYYGCFDSLYNLLSENKIKKLKIDKFGKNLLHYVLMSQEPSERMALRLIQFILQNREPKYMLNQCDINGETPLIIAGQKRYINVFHVLIKLGVDTNLKDDAGMTAHDWLNISLEENINHDVTNYSKRMTNAIT